VVAAATAARGSAASLALALGISGLTTIEHAVAQCRGLVGHGPLLAPAVLVVSADSASKRVSQLEHKGLFLESSSVHDNFGRLAGILDVGVDTVGANALHLVFDISVARVSGGPSNDGLIAVSLALANQDW
jgi:hypothetical protein